MKTGFFVLAFMLLNLMSAYCGGALEMELVNVQEISLEQIDTIKINYRSERISLLSGNTDSFILKEYMNKNNSKYYAKISNAGNKLVVEAGQRPISIGFGNLRRRVEVYIPTLDGISISIKTSSGNIEANDEYTAPSMAFETSSGNISANSINGDVFIRTSSGNIRFENAGGDADIRADSGEIVFDKIGGHASIETSSGNISGNAINGDVSARSSSGRISIGPAGGKADLKTSSGRINYFAAKNSGDISISAASGDVILDIAKNSTFNFSSRTRSGALRTPFSDKLFRSLSDGDYVQGAINGDTVSENQNVKNIDINTSSGSIKVNWR